jgi:hypothetical protein
MDGLMRNKLISISMVCLAALAQGCLSTDTVGDTTDQQRNKENIIADSIAKPLNQVKGSFEGQLNGSAMVLTLDVARQPSTGGGPGGLGLASEPYLAGDLYVEPPIYVETATGKPMMIPYNVTNGQISDGHNLSLTITVNNNPTTAICQVTNNNNNIDCAWYVNATDAKSAHFQMSRLALGQSLVADPARSQGTYFGTSSYNHDITAKFDTREHVQSGPNSMPVVSIGGWVKKDGRVYQFEGSAYDPINSTLVIPIVGSNSPEVNCRVISADKLSCTWYGRQGLPGTDDTGNDETFVLSKSS